MVNVVTNSQLMAIEQEAEDDKEASFNAPALEGIAAHINKCWEASRSAKSTVKERILAAQRSRRGEYDPQKLSEIRAMTGGSEEFGRIVSNKCRIAEAWLRDVYLGQAEKAWTLAHTPVPDLTPDDLKEVADTLQRELIEATALTGKSPPQQMLNQRRNELTDAIRMRVKEEARLAIQRMEDKMADQMVDGLFDKEWTEFLNDFVTYPAAHFKGPIFRRKTMLKWQQSEGGWKPVADEIIVPTFERVDPLRAYPSPGAVSPQDGYWIEHITIDRSELYDLIGVEGYREDAIREVLSEATSGGIYNWLSLSDVSTSESERGNHRVDQAPITEIDALEYYGPIPGYMLLDWGMSKSDITDKDKDYEVTAWLIGRHVIKAQLNPNPMGMRPVYKGCWEEIPGEYWGQGLPDGLRDIEGVTNAALRALVNNMSIASGPQVQVNVDRLPPGEDLETMHPWKIWQTQDSQYGSNDKAIDFFQPSMNSAEIIGVLDKFYQYADDWSLIPRYMGGSDNISGGIGRTASGMSMLFNAANKGLKGVVGTIDTKVLSPMLTQLYQFNMEFEDDDSIKGDAQVVARGAVALMQIETLQLRRNEFLQATANPLDSQIVGAEGRAEILREVAKDLGMDVNRVIPMRGAVPQGDAGTPNGQQAMSEPNKDQLFTGAAVTNNVGNNDMRSPV
jgi:hypothetical protein